MNEYEKLLDQAKTDPDNLDFYAFRMAYANSPLYDPYSENTETKDLLNNANEEQDWLAAASIIDEMLRINYVDFMTHIRASNVFKYLSDNDKSNYHYKIALGLINSFPKGEKNDSFDTAYIVINVDEEYNFIKFWGVELISQSLCKKDGHEYDVLYCLDPKTGNKKEKYFNIDIPKRWLKNTIRLPEELDF